jgi:DNA-binding CsgD family transcriptional regulator
MDRGQRAIAILSMLGSAAKALEEDADVEHVLCVYLTGALGADVGVCFALQLDGGADPITTHPRGPIAAGLVDRLAEVVDGVPDDAPVLIDDVALGQVLVLVPRPAIPPPLGVVGSRGVAFASNDGFAEADVALLRETVPVLVALLPHVVAASQRRQRAEAGQQAAGEFGLTARELEVLVLLAQGLLATSIASRLSLSPRTVHKHLGNIYDKLGVHDRLVAVSLARSRYLVPDPAA